MIITRRNALIGALAAPAIIRPARAMVVPRRFSLAGGAGLISPSRRPILATATQNLSFSVAGGGGFPGQPGNPVGFAAAPGYPGSLTAMAVSSIASGQTYNYKLFDNGTSAIHISATNCTFNGCYFGASTSVSTSQAHTTWTGGNNISNFCTFAPSPSVVGGTFPPQAGGYSTWPCGPTATLPAVYGNNYGCVGGGNTPPPTGGLIFNSCDMWGYSNGVVFSKVAQTNPLAFNNCWIHDPNIQYDGNHTDGIGDVQSQATDYIQYLTINGCTIAVICNSNDIAFQPSSPSSWLMNNNQITNNYITSTASYVVQSGLNRTTTAPTNNVFTGNVFSAYLACEYGVLYENDTSIFSTSGSGNLWRNNQILPGTYNQVGTVTAAAPYLWPNATANATDFTGPD